MPAQKVDIHLTDATSSYHFSIRSFGNVTLLLHEGITTHILVTLYFRTNIVGSNSATANDLKDCIADWLASDTPAAQSFSIGGDPLMVSTVDVLVSVCCKHDVHNCHLEILQL